MPQVPPDSTWQGRSAQTALRALDRTTAEFNTDPARTYLAGMSMGGNGSWALAYRQPGRFAALVVVCGFVSRLHDFPAVVEGDPATIPQRVAERIAPLPVWMVHGDADPVVPVEESRRMDAALRAAGGEVHYTELPGVGHNCWDAAFNDPALPSWLFAQVMR